MLKFVLPSDENRADVLDFYREIAEYGGECIGKADSKDYAKWLKNMQNRYDGKNLPQGYVRENFYLCYDGEELVGVFSLKFELTKFLLDFGGHVGYAVRPQKRNRGYATKILEQGLHMAKDLGFNRILCVCDEDNYAFEKVIVKKRRSVGKYTLRSRRARHRQKILGEFIKYRLSNIVSIQLGRSKA